MTRVAACMLLTDVALIVVYWPVKAKVTARGFGPIESSQNNESITGSLCIVVGKFCDASIQVSAVPQRPTSNLRPNILAAFIACHATPEQ